MSNGNGGNGTTIDILGPDGLTYPAPLNKVRDMVAAGGVIKGSPTEMAGQALAASGIPAGPQLQSAAQTSLAPAIPQMDMQESLAPKIARGVGYALPVAGGITGGIVGAGAGGLGAVGGAGLGAGLGQVGQQFIQGSLAVPGGQYGEQPPTPQESARSVALAGALGAAGEGAGGLLIGAGGKVLGRIAAAQTAKEGGSAAAGLAEQTPIAFSARGLQRTLNAAYDNLSGQLSNVLQGSTGTTSLSQTIAPTVQRAAQSQVPRVARNLDNIITAAKEVAGIQGDQLTADQMLTFAQKLIKPRTFTENYPGPQQALLNSYLQEMYAHAGNAVRALAPESDPLLGQLQNIHAARNAIQAYQPNWLASTLATAATHPHATAALSPAITIGGALAPSITRRQIANIAGEFLP